MNREQIKALALQAGMTQLDGTTFPGCAMTPEVLERFARLCIAQGLEMGAERCAEYSTDKWSLYKGRQPYNGSEEGHADPHVQGEHSGASDCEEALRAMAAEVRK